MNRTTILAAAVALAVGLAAGFALGQTEPGHDSPAIVNEPADPAPAARQPAAPVGSPAGDEPATPAKLEPAPKAADHRPADLIRAVTEQLVAEEGPVVRGDGQITVLLADADGAPVPGIKMTLRLDVGAISSSYPSRHTFEDDVTYLEERVRAHIRADVRALRAQEISVSDAQGRAVWTQLPGKRSYVSVETEDYLIDGKPTLRNHPVEVGQTLKLVLTRTYPIPVVVRNQTTTEVADCRVTWKSLTDGSGSEVSAGIGATTTLRLPAGTYTIAAYHRDRNLQAAPSQVAPGPGAAPVELELKSAALLSGALRFAEGTPRDIRVCAAPALPGATDREVLLGSSAGRENLELNKERTRFEARKPMKGECVVGVVFGDLVLASKRVTLGNESQQVDFDIAMPSGDIRLKLKVISPVAVVSGRPGVAAWDADKPRERIERVPGRPMEPESQEFSGKLLKFQLWDTSVDESVLIFAPEPPLPVKAGIRLHHPDLGTVISEFQPGVTPELIIRFEAPVKPRVVFKGLQESPHFPQFRVIRVDDGLAVPASHYFHGRASEKAGHEMQALQPGNYRFELRGSPRSGFLLSEKTVGVDATTGTITMEVPELHSVKLDGSDCKPYAHADVVQKSSGTWQHITFDDSDSRILEGLPPGEYEVFYTSGGIHGPKKSQVFSVPSASAVVLAK